MTPRRSTARSRDIGLELLAIREKAGYDGIGLANRLGWDQSKVSRIEGGKQAVDEVDLISWLTSCDVKYPQLRQLVNDNREATRDTWVVPHSPTSGRALVAEERAAKTITHYACVLIPGLLQTRAYAQATIGHWHQDEKTILLTVEQRMTRQEVLPGERAPKVVFYIEEGVLLRTASDAEIGEEQLLHLMFMADWKKVSIRILPTSAGVHSAGQGSFTFIERRDGILVARIDTRATALVMENEVHIAAYQETIKELDGLAMSEGQSRKYIASLVAGPREESDDDGRGGVA
ncbi:helix-turn-helix domain-containing protein [Lentzea tibetensis]|uniref:Helix-turn-helix domain-containing protein n=1 Tax=Lentzea tibetensis TaxID=2591470 RepID=A0A563ESC3_9PSEU|nr:helix-turn-helix transcriptional regulator [Lentzea tibetensis]TWP50625.1 helix-turn-helix domain-containing protein [Lentzea tibetensis]